MTFISRLHADLRHTHITKRGATHHPKDVPQGVHKEYLRMRRLSLPTPLALTASLTDVIEKRQSAVSGSSEVISLEEISTLLFGLRRKAQSHRRNYPSGGGLYPIETYLVATGLKGESPAVFHYHPTKHALEHLWNLPSHFSMKDVTVYADSLKPTLLIVFTSVWHRSSAKYGDLAYIHALLEAGHMSQNILLASTALEMASRPLAGFKDEVLIRLLDLDEDLEQPLHVISIAKGQLEHISDSVIPDIDAA